MANQTGRPIAPARKLVAAVLGTFAVFVMVFGLGLSSWPIVALGAALLALAIALGMVNVVRRGARAWVAGHGQIKAISEAPPTGAYGRAEIQLVVVAPGLPVTEVLVRDPRVPVSKWPRINETLPISVDVDDMRRVKIEWAEVDDRAVDGDPPPPAFEPAEEFLDDDLLGEPEPPPWVTRDRQWGRGPDEPLSPAGAAAPAESSVATEERPGAPIVVHDTPGGPVLEGQLVEHEQAPRILPQRAPRPTASAATTAPPEQEDRTADSPADDRGIDLLADDRDTEPTGEYRYTTVAPDADDRYPDSAAHVDDRFANPAPDLDDHDRTSAPDTDDRYETPAPDLDDHFGTSTSGSDRFAASEPRDDEPAARPAAPEPDQPSPASYTPVTDQTHPSAAQPDAAQPSRKPSPRPRKTDPAAAAAVPADLSKEADLSREADLSQDDGLPKDADLPKDDDASPAAGPDHEIDLALDADPEPQPEFSPQSRQSLDDGLIASPADTSSRSWVAGSSVSYPPTEVPRPSQPHPDDAAAVPATAPTTPPEGDAGPREESRPAAHVPPQPTADTPRPREESRTTETPQPTASQPAADAVPRPRDPDRDAPTFRAPQPNGDAPVTPTITGLDTTAPESPSDGKNDPEPAPSPKNDDAAAAPATGVAEVPDADKIAAVPVVHRATKANRPGSPWADLEGTGYEPDDRTDEVLTAYPSARPGPAGAINGVGITVLVTDIARSISFYRDTLGFFQIDTGSSSAVLASGDTRLVLRTVHSLASDIGRLIYLNLEVGDVDALYEELKAKGVKFLHGPRPVSRGDKLELWAATFYDPDGHNIAVTQWRAIR